MPAAVRRAVLARDRGQCRICGQLRYVDVHHLYPQSAGGEHSRENCACLCTGCHAAVHAGALRIEGSAEGQLRWTDRDGNPAGSEQEGGGRSFGLASAEEVAAARRAMGGRGGYTAERLAQEWGSSSLRASAALQELELRGELVRSGPPLTPVYGPPGGPACEQEPAVPPHATWPPVPEGEAQPEAEGATEPASAVAPETAAVESETAAAAEPEPVVEPAPEPKATAESGQAAEPAVPASKVLAAAPAPSARRAGLEAGDEESDTGVAADELDPADRAELLERAGTQAQVLRVMAERPTERWTVDRLCGATGLDVRRVSRAVWWLDAEGRIRDAAFPLRQYVLAGAAGQRAQAAGPGRSAGAENPGSTLGSSLGPMPHLGARDAPRWGAS